MGPLICQNFLQRKQKNLAETTNFFYIQTVYELRFIYPVTFCFLVLYVQCTADYLFITYGYCFAIYIVKMCEENTGTKKKEISESESFKFIPLSIFSSFFGQKLVVTVTKVCCCEYRYLPVLRIRDPGLGAF